MVARSMDGTLSVRWVNVTAVVVAVITILGSIYTAATWVGAKVDAPAKALAATIEPRLLQVESNQTNFLKASDFREFEQLYWAQKKADAVTEQSVAVTVGQINTKLDNLKDQQTELRQEVQAIKR